MRNNAIRRREHVYDFARSLCFLFPSLLGVGARDEVFRRFGNAQVYEKAILKSVALPEMALAYAKDDGGAAALLVIQPDEAMAAGLRSAARASAGGRL